MSTKSVLDSSCATYVRSGRSRSVCQEGGECVPKSQKHRIFAQVGLLTA